MSDGTQALCWREVAKTAEWLATFEAISSTVAPTSVNRMERFYYARTAAHVLKRIGAHQRALKVIGTIDLLAGEDPDWSERWWVEIEAGIAWADVLAALNPAKLPAAVAAVVERIHAIEYIVATHDGRERLRVLYHNVGGVLYFARLYADAIPLFERAIDLGTLAPYSYAWLAAVSLHHRNADERTHCTHRRSGGALAGRDPRRRTRIHS